MTSHKELNNIFLLPCYRGKKCSFYLCWFMYSAKIFSPEPPVFDRFPYFTFRTLRNTLLAVFQYIESYFLKLLKIFAVIWVAGWIYHNFGFYLKIFSLFHTVNAYLPTYLLFLLLFFHFLIGVQLVQNVILVPTVH